MPPTIALSSQSAVRGSMLLHCVPGWTFDPNEALPVWFTEEEEKYNKRRGQDQAEAELIHKLGDARPGYRSTRSNGRASLRPELPISKEAMAQPAAQPVFLAKRENHFGLSFGFFSEVPGQAAGDQRQARSFRIPHAERCGARCAPHVLRAALQCRPIRKVAEEPRPICSSPLCSALLRSGSGSFLSPGTGPEEAAPVQKAREAWGQVGQGASRCFRSFACELRAAAQRCQGCDPRPCRKLRRS